MVQSPHGIYQAYPWFGWCIFAKKKCKNLTFSIFAEFTRLPVLNGFETCTKWHRTLKIWQYLISDDNSVTFKWRAGNSNDHEPIDPPLFQDKIPDWAR